MNGEMAETSATIGKLVEALAKAQSEFEPILKETDNPAYVRGGKAMKYADLPTLVAATQPALSKNGLVIIQMPDVDVETHTLTLTGLLAHSSGEFIRSVLHLPAVQRDRFDPQSCGSAITYAKRYQWGALIGAAPEDDDDGNAASGIGSKEAAKEVLDRKTAAAKQALGVTGHPTDVAKFVAPSALKVVSFLPMNKDWTQLSGDGLPTLLAWLEQKNPQFKHEHMELHADDDPLFGFWRVKSEFARDLQEIVVSIGLDAKPAAKVAEIASNAQQKANGEGLANDERDPFRDIKPKMLTYVRLVKNNVSTPFIVLRYGETEHSCFDQGLWDYLERGSGHPAKLELSKPTKKNNKTYQNIVGIDQIGDRTYSDNKPDRYPSDLGTETPTF